MKNVIVMMIILMFCMNVKATTYTVTLATEDLDADAPLIEALTAKGFKVYATSKYWQNITDEKVTELNSYDLLVITRQINSSSYQGEDGTFDLWAEVTTPIINMSQYIGRSSKMQMFNSQSISEDIGSVMEVKQLTHPVFSGITISDNLYTGELASPGFSGVQVVEAGNGSVIASSSSSGYVAIAEWKAGTAYYTDSVDSPPVNQGDRMWFSGIKASDGYAYSETGLELFTNAAEYMITGTVSDSDESINSNKFQAEDFTSGEGVTVMATSDTDGGENDIVFTDEGQWVEYNLEVQTADYYTFSFRASSNGSADTLRIYEDDNIIGHAIVSGEEYQTISIPIQLSNIGVSTIKIEAVSNVDSVKINWIDYIALELGGSSMIFDATAKPSQILIDGMSVLNSSSSSYFTLMEFDGESINSSTSFSCTDSVNYYTVKPSDVDLEFTFRVDTYSRHVSLHLVDVKGEVVDRRYGLKLSIEFNQTMAYKTTSDLLVAGYSSNALTLYWDNLWGVEWDGNRGGIIIWDGTLSGDDLDLALAEIWTTEEYVEKPAGQVSWTSSDVINWTDGYAAKFNNMTQIQLEPTSNEELYSLMDELVEPLGIKQVYLHCGVWRGEYWLDDYAFDHVNTDIFPEGKTDLKAFADYLHERDMTLALHSLSFSIGPNDTTYIGETVDRRLARWTSGTLDADISDSDTRIYYRPDSVEMLYRSGSVHMDGKIYFNYMRIGEELVGVESFSRTEKDIWVIDLASRGYGATSAYSHSEGTEIDGLLMTYAKNYIPEFDMGQDSSLSDEMIKTYYDLVNEMGLDHIHFDGSKSNAKYKTWSARPMFDATYAGSERMVTTSVVGGNLDANFELEFSKIKDDLSYTYFPLEIGLRLHDSDPDNLASSFMGVHMHAAECILLDARRVNFIGIKNANGITQEVLDNHGLTQNSKNIFVYWKEIAPVITDADVSYISDKYSKTSGSKHYESDDALILSINDEGKYIFTPYHVLGLADGSTDPWKIYQEHGAVRRSVFVDAGEEMELTNPKGEHDLNVIIRVVEDSPSITNPSVELSTGGYINFTGIIEEYQYLRYEMGDTTATICDKNWMPVDTIPVSQNNFVAPDGDLTATINGTGEANLEVQLYVIDDSYVLTTNDVLGR
jgi:hypothetical protein